MAQAEAELVRAELSGWAGLGEPWLELAAEFRRLQQRLRQRRWALRQLRPPDTPPSDGQGPATTP